MNQIKITTGNQDRIQAAIDAAQKRSKVRTIDASDVFCAVATVEKHLSRAMYKKDWAGLSIDCDPNAQRFANAYKYIPESTRIVIERRKTGWFLADISRGQCDTKYLRCSFQGRGEQLEQFATDHFCD